MKIKQIQIITFLFCVFTQNIYAQNTQTMLQRENLKGKVKSIYVTNGEIYVKVWFDKKGKIIKREDTKLGTDITLVRENFVYDDKGHILSFIGYNIAAPTNKDKATYKYTNNGEVEFYWNEQSPYTFYKYDERGNCIWEMRRNYDNNYIERIYNEKNQLVEAFSHKGPTRLNVWKTDSTGRRAYEETRWTEPEKTNHTFFEYNEYGDVSLVTLKTENGYTILNKTSVITYNRYDDAGNWLEQTFPTELSCDGNNVDDYNVYSAYNKYFEIYDTHIEGLHITRIIEYYNK